MEPNEFLDPNSTVYKEDQIITRRDLIMFAQILEDEYAATDPRMKQERAHLITAIKTVDTLLTWLTTGKDKEFRGML